MRYFGDGAHMGDAPEESGGPEKEMNMADEENASEAAAKPEPEAALMEEAEIMNTTREGLTFRVPGKSLYLAPGQSLKLPKAYLDTVEITTLCRHGDLVETPRARNPSGGDAAPERDGEGKPEDPGARGEAIGRSPFRRK